MSFHPLFRTGILNASSTSIPGLPFEEKNEIHLPLPPLPISWAYQVALVVKNPLPNAGGARDVGSIPGSGRSPWGGHGYPLQYSCLEKPMDRGAWQAIVHGVTESNITKQITMHVLRNVTLSTRLILWKPFSNFMQFSQIPEAYPHWFLYYLNLT